MIDDKIKEEVSGKYKELLKLVYVVGNGIMLQADFLELGKLFGLIKSDYHWNKIIEELEGAELVKRNTFLDTKYKIIILKKYSIRFLEGKNKSSDVASIPKNTTTRSVHSVIKTDYFKRFSKKLKNDKDFNLDYCIEKAKKQGATFLYTQGQGHLYLENFKKLDIYNPNNEIYDRTLKQQEIANANRKKGQDSKKKINNLYSDNVANIKEILESNIEKIEYKDTRTKIEKELEKLTIDTLMSSNIYITKLEKKDDKVVVYASVWDVDDTQNTKKIIEKILKTMYVFTKIINKQCVYKIRIMARSQGSTYNYQKRLNKINTLGKTYFETQINTYVTTQGAGGSKVIEELKIDIYNDIELEINKSILAKYYN